MVQISLSRIQDKLLLGLFEKLYTGSDSLLLCKYNQNLTADFEFVSYPRRCDVFPFIF